VVIKISLTSTIRWSGSSDRAAGSFRRKRRVSRNDKSFRVSSPVSATSERTDSLRSGERSLDSSVLGRKDGYDRKSLPRRNWLYKIGSAPGSYTCLLRMQTSSPNARKPHESARRVDVPPTRTVCTDIHGAVLPIPAEISVRARLRACSRAGFKKSRDTRGALGGRSNRNAAQTPPPFRPRERNRPCERRSFVSSLGSADGNSRSITERGGYASPSLIERTESRAISAAVLITRKIPR